ncbi:hypothetical protein BKP56_05465 [Marinilactibacillus sp. 15R]|uniref:hypothetical protein n=1 Tax=Marinilactibacillus sp. 15R TaxID=1911586 RepID=UPI00090B9F4A|nr:hypothetical protein [Marinilactibacillus sp. 15R]API88769.1 hypothetical protein BKP56_05465 [Marinilactibacillus sp. 15R]
MTYKQDSSGINSLSGFAYQIKVFAYYAFDLKENMQIEFETLEDINLKSITPDTIDINSHKFICRVTDGSKNKAIQVKHTSISNSVSEQLIFNWLLLESSAYNIEEYILFTDKNYQNKNDIFIKDVKKMYKDILQSNKNKNATVSKVKALFEGDFAKFEQKYNQIHNKYTFIDLEDVNAKTEDKASLHFRKAANVIIFQQRLGEFLQHITYKILNTIENKEPYILTYQEFINIVEDISNRFTKDITAPSYSNFKRIKKIDLKDSVLSNSREYKQLKTCKLPDSLIEQHLLYGMYYNETSLKYMENNKLNKIEEIEDTTFEGFENVKFSLIREKNDSPYNRLERTKKYPNSYAENDQIKFGASIHLTKKDVLNNQISWKDDEDA